MESFQPFLIGISVVCGTVIVFVLCGFCYYLLPSFTSIVEGNCQRGNHSQPLDASSGPSAGVEMTSGGLKLESGVLQGAPASALRTTDAPVEPEQRYLTYSAPAAQHEEFWSATTLPTPLFDLEAALLASQESYSDTVADLDNVLKASEKEESDSAAERAAAGARLDANLRPWGLEEEDVPGDNNCLFHALVLQLGRMGLYEGNAKALRESLVAWMISNPDYKIDEAGVQGEATSLKDFVGSDEQWETYLLKMGAHGKEWGDHLVLVVASEVYRVPILIFSSAAGGIGTPIKIAPPSGEEVDEGKTIHLGHYIEQHYVSTRRRAASPPDIAAISLESDEHPATPPPDIATTSLEADEIHAASLDIAISLEADEDPETKSTTPVTEPKSGGKVRKLRAPHKPKRKASMIPPPPLKH